MESLRNLQEIASEVQTRFSKYEGFDFILPDEFKESVNEINSGSVTYYDYSAIVESSGDLHIWLPNQWFYIASYFTEYYNELLLYKSYALKVASKERLKILNNFSLSEKEEANLQSLSIDEISKNYLRRFITDYSWWGGAKTIDRGDFFVSPILSYAKLVNASQSYIADLCAFLANKQDLVRLIIEAEYKQSQVRLHMIKMASNKPFQQIFYGAPGTGKSFAIDNLTNDDNTIRTTFHPDSDYASFVGAYKPTMEDVPINSIYGESVQYATGKNGHPGTEKKIVYKYVPQAFLKAYVAAWTDLDNPHYLVIEEINRGNCAQIFGDLFQLLDRNSHGCSSYAIHADDDIRQFLAADNKGFGNLSEEQKHAIADFVLVKDNGKRSEIGKKILSGELLLLPPNLRIWATMNTSDQSLFPIDSAFKRRWNWHYVPIEYDKKDWLLHIGDNYYRWGDFLKAINPIISELTESADKQMGYFFAKPDEKHGETTENNTISEDVFINKVLFYLWTDVLKDFDAGKEPFLNPDTKRAYEFSDFFDAKYDYLEQFVGKLGLEIVDINFDSITDDVSDDNESTSTDAGQRDYSQYSINGEGKYNKRQTVLRALRKYVEANPSMTSEEIIENWENVNPEIPYFILTASEYETRIKELPAQRDRYWSVKTGTAEMVYITNQWGAGRIAEFINLINNSNFGLHIDKVTE